MEEKIKNNPKKTRPPALRMVWNLVAQTSGKPNSQALCWLLPLRRTTVRRNGKAFWFNLPLLVYKAFLFSLTFFFILSLYQ